MNQQIQTSAGLVDLIPPPKQLLAQIQTSLPMGIVVSDQTADVPTYGIIMKAGTHEVFGVKQQLVDFDRDTALVNFHAHACLIAYSMASYVRLNYRGLIMPCAYMRKKQDDQVESGIAYFGKPVSDHNETESRVLSRYDEVLGNGFSNMLDGFFNAMQRAGQETGIEILPTIGLDIRSRLSLGSIGFGFMAINRSVVCLKTAISEQDP